MAFSRDYKVAQNLALISGDSVYYASTFLETSLEVFRGHCLYSLGSLSH